MSGLGIFRASAIQKNNSKSTGVGPNASSIISTTALRNCSNVRPSSAEQMSSKLLSVTSSPLISTVIPVGDSNAVSSSRNDSSLKRKSSKQDSISSASGHSSFPANI